MKKFLFSLIAMTAFTLAAFQVVEIRDPQSGEGFTSGAGGKLVAVQAFSTNATGTVALSSVWRTAAYTNATAIVSATSTNYVVVSSNRVASAMRSRSIRVQDGILVTTNAFTHLVETNIAYRVVVTNLPNQVVFTNTLDAADFGPFTVSAWNAGMPFDTLLSVSTNVATIVSTNVWPVYSHMVAVTNSLVTGSCSTNVYSGSPAATTYLLQHEWLVFTGTATGGWLRLVFE